MLGGGCSERPLAGGGRMRPRTSAALQAGQAVTPGDHRGVGVGEGGGWRGRSARVGTSAEGHSCCRHARALLTLCWPGVTVCLSVPSPPWVLLPLTVEAARPAGGAQFGSLVVSPSWFRVGYWGPGAPCPPSGAQLQEEGGLRAHRPVRGLLCDALFGFSHIVPFFSLDVITLPL